MVQVAESERAYLREIALGGSAVSDEVYVEITLLNKTWEFRGLDAVSELVCWMDDHASNAWLSPGNRVLNAPPDSAESTSPRADGSAA